MAATTAMRTQLRLMIHEATRRFYDDDSLDTHIEQHPLHDLNSNSPYMEDGSGNLITNTDWTATYDLNATAADIWLEKSGRLTEENFDHQESSGRSALWRGKSAVTANAMRMHRLFSSRRAAKSVQVTPLDNPAEEDQL